MGSTGPGGTELYAHVHQQEVVASLGQHALESDSLDSLMRSVTRAVSDTLATEFCYILELMPDGDGLVLRRGTGWRDGLVGEATVPTARGSQAGYTLLREQPVIVDDLREEERFRGSGLLVSHDVVSGVSAVIGSVDDPWGVLGTHTTAPREFTDQDATFVQSVANVLAAAIERADNERRLREREAQLNVATTAGRIGLWQWDIQADVVTVDEFLAEAYGMDPAVVGTGAPMAAFYEPIPDDERDGTLARLERALETGELAAEYRVRNADGELMWVVARGEVEYDADGTPVQMHGAVADITELKQRERALKERKERYRDLFTSMSEGYCVIEKVDTAPGEPIDFRYVEANPAFEAQSGVGDVVGKTIREVVPGEAQAWFDTYDDVLRTGEAVSFERELVTQGRVLECYAFPVGDGTNEQVGVLFTDVTELVEREQQLQAMIERLEASNERLEQFAYAASHDLQEPLRMVSSYLQLIESRYAEALDADGEEFIAFAVDGADRMREMIDGLLEYACVESKGEPFEPVDLEDVFDDVLTDLQFCIEESGAEISAGSLPRVQGDGGQLRQVFQNLLSNAMEYSGDQPPRVEVTAEREGSEWTIAVRDEGIGIRPEDQDRIFELFHRLQEDEQFPGTGIGLALSERIIERHGGELWVDSQPGEGSTFAFTLPAADDTAP